MNLLSEWANRERFLTELAAYFSDVVAKAYAEGAAFATRRCREDLTTNDVWAKGYEAGLRKGMKVADADTPDRPT